jgi:hypothetical protein
MDHPSSGSVLQQVPGRTQRNDTGQTLCERAVLPVETLPRLQAQPDYRSRS